MSKPSLGIVRPPSGFHVDQPPKRWGDLVRSATNTPMVSATGIWTMGTRFFGATAFHGKLYVEGILDRSPWDNAKLIYWTEEQVNMILNPRIGDRKARTTEELKEALDASRLRHPAIKIWVAEGLERGARRILAEQIGSSD